MKKEEKITFFVVKRETIETENNRKVCRVRLKSAEGHVLTLVSDDETIFHGYPIGAPVKVTIMNPQATLQDAFKKEAGS